MQIIRVASSDTGGEYDVVYSLPREGRYRVWVRVYCTVLYCTVLQVPGLGARVRPGRARLTLPRHLLRRAAAALLAPLPVLLTAAASHQLGGQNQEQEVHTRSVGGAVTITVSFDTSMNIVYQCQLNIRQETSECAPPQSAAQQPQQRTQLVRIRPRLRPGQCRYRCRFV